MNGDIHRISRIAFVGVWIAASAAMGQAPPKHTLRIIEDVPADTDRAVVREWRSEVTDFRSRLEQVEHVRNENPDYTFRQFEIITKGDGEWLSLTLRARYQPRDAASASEIRPPSECEWCPRSHVRRLFLETVQTKLFDAEQGLYRPYAVRQCVRDKITKVAITVQSANGLRLEPNVIYLIGEWMPFRNTKRLVTSPVSLNPVDPGADRLNATFEVQAPTEELRERFLSKDCVGVPPHPIVLVPRLVMPLRAGTRNGKVQ
jgi:hypothetical protein